jgi:hypothetical protein
MEIPKNWKCLSMRQPWAWAIVEAGKFIENRSWRTQYRGPLLIHAGLDIDCFGAMDLRRYLNRPLDECRLPRGGIVGVATLVDCVDKADTVWFCGPRGFVLANAMPLPFVPMRGSVGIFDVPKENLSSIEAELVDWLEKLQPL